MKLAYSIAEAAAMISVSPKHLYNQIKAGKLKASKPGGRLVITLEQIKQYLAECQISTSSQSQTPTVHSTGSKADQLGLLNRKSY